MIEFPLTEMCCPHCAGTQTLKIRGLNPHLTNCVSCKKLLVVDVLAVTKEGANIDVLRVESKTPAEQEKPKLGAVA